MFELRVTNVESNKIGYDNEERNIGIDNVITPFIQKSHVIIPIIVSTDFPVCTKIINQRYKHLHNPPITVMFKSSSQGEKFFI